MTTDILYEVTTVNRGLPTGQFQIQLRSGFVYGAIDPITAFNVSSRTTSLVQDKLKTIPLNRTLNPVSLTRYTIRAHPEIFIT